MTDKTPVGLDGVEMRITPGYQTPPRPWAVDPREQRVLLGLHPNILELVDLRPPRGRGPLYGVLFPLLNRVPVIRAIGVTALPVMRARFGLPPRYGAN